MRVGLLQLPSFQLLGMPSPAPTPAQSDDAPPQSGRADSNMVTQWRARNAAQRRRISSAIENNLELQMLVLSTIENYEAAKRVAEAQGVGVASFASRKKVKKEEKDEAITEPNATLKKSRLLYCRWNKQWLKELLVFVSQGSVTMDSLKGMGDKARLQEVCTAIFDIDFTDESPEKSSNPSATKLSIFTRLRSLYAKLGERMDGWQDQLANGYVKWEEAGHYSIKNVSSGSGGSAEVVIECKTMGKTAKITDDLAPELQEGYEILANFSLDQAYIKTETGLWRCQNFFPSIGRTLKRNLSAQLEGDPTLKKAIKKDPQGEQVADAETRAVPKAKAAAAKSGNSASTRRAPIEIAAGAPPSPS